MEPAQEVPCAEVYRFSQMLDSNKQKEPDNGEWTSVSVDAYYRLNAPRVSVCYDPKWKNYIYKRGYIYNVNIGVYGLGKIKVTTTIDGWVNGGEVEVPFEDLE